MKRNLKLYITLFFSTLKLSAFTFGGGFVIISLMKKEFVEKYGWISEEDMLNYTAIAQSSPGAIAINASLLVGFHIGGFLGAVVTVIASALPPLIILSVISFFYTWFRDNTVVRFILMGMQAGVAAVLFDVIIGLCVSMWKDSKLFGVIIALCISVWKDSKFFALIIAVLTFVLVAFLSINILYIILACAVAGAIFFSKRRKEHDIS